MVKEGKQTYVFLDPHAILFFLFRALDISKQFAGGIIIHSLNVVAAVFFGIKPEEGVKANPCVW